jgi:sarcosine oxidase subunit alpha
VRPDRKQLVGLLPIDPQTLPPEGAQIVARDAARRPLPMIGHVTSSYRSAALGRTFALAMVAGGRKLIGSRVFAPLPQGTIEAEVTAPAFWDPEGTRRDG